MNHATALDSRRRLHVIRRARERYDLEFNDTLIDAITARVQAGQVSIVGKGRGSIEAEVVLGCPFFSADQRTCLVRFVYDTALRQVVTVLPPRGQDGGYRHARGHMPAAARRTARKNARLLRQREQQRCLCKESEI